MFDFMRQRKRILILFTGCLLVPFLLGLTLFYIGFSERNLSGLLNEPSFFPYVHIAAMCMLAWLIYLLNILARKCDSRLKPGPGLVLLALLISGALWIGWSSTNGFLAFVHIALGYGGLVWMNVLFYAWVRYETRYVNIYICLCFTAFIWSVSKGYVSGISEVLYAAGCSVLLSLYAAEK